MIPKQDKEVQKLVRDEEKRQKETIDLIASENYTSKYVREALASIFGTKYAEGYPGARYYNGNAVADKLEKLTQARALKLLRLSGSKWSVNVQPYSGSPANLAVLNALVPKGGKIMGMALDMGGHLTHGHAVSVTGKFWKQVPYGVKKETEQIDYEELMHRAKKERPRLVIAGGTAYSRVIDFKKFRKIADSVKAYLMVDMSHFAGLVAGGVYPSPFRYADVVTSTTHKTLRGPRAALIFSKKELGKVIDRSVFPGLQGGPHLNTIAGVAVALGEAGKSGFKNYASQVVTNAKVLAEELEALGWRIVSGGTDTHLFLVDTAANGISGKDAADALEDIGIVVNKNAIPYDTRRPADPSGIRIGTAAMTTRGMKEKHMRQIARFIHEGLLKRVDSNTIRKKVRQFILQFQRT